ncbi:nuclear transport factor 2 family protein [Streptomyces sp. NPDC002138]|uniref:nuclear transport factor 2 family protein n=1 Tax=Streptomyces sp. NPDC002138 TaxID=3154410 RepID=UPI0033341400
MSNTTTDTTTDFATRTTPRTHARTHTDIATALRDLLFSPGSDLDEVADRHFAPDYRQRTDGSWADRAGFLDHIAHLRTVVAEGSVEVHEELSDGTLYADRHTVHVTKKDGSTVSMEVYLFGEFAPDGRFRRIEETTLMLDGDPTDRNLGSAR